MSVGCPATRGHVDVSGLCSHLKAIMISVGLVATKGNVGFVVLLQLGAVLMSMFCVTTKGPENCPWSVLLPKTMLMTLGCAATRVHVGVHGPCCPESLVDVPGLGCC